MKPLEDPTTSKPYQLTKPVVAALCVAPMMLSLGSAVVWAGTQDFSASDYLWKAILEYAVFLVLLVVTLYYAFRKESPVWVNGILSILGFVVPASSVFGTVYFFFYFSVAPMPPWIRAMVLAGGTGIMLDWGRKTWIDTARALKDKNLFLEAYSERENHFLYSWDFMQKLQLAAPERNPFSKIHVWAAVLLAPFAVVLNKMLIPYTGSGHGVFIIVSFFGIPMSLWLVGIAVKTFFLMIYMPMKIKHNTGKPVFMIGFD